MLIEMIAIAGLALACALVAAYLLGEANGSRALYEPLPPPALPEPRPAQEQYELVGHLEDSVVVDLLPPVTATELEQLDAKLGHYSTEVERAAALANRYRREALVMRKRYEAAVDMLLSPRRPSQKAIEKAVVEVRGREVPVVRR
jgi:hypothetical protein